MTMNPFFYIMEILIESSLVVEHFHSKILVVITVEWYDPAYEKLWTA